AANRAGVCPQCRGAGLTICSGCRDGWTQCGACRGYRRISCSVCAGKGEMLRSLYVEINYRSEIKNATVLPANFPDYARKQLNANFETASVSVFQLQGDEQLDNRSIAEIPHNELKSKIDALVSDLMSQQEKNGEGR